MAGEESLSGSIQPAITGLRRLAALHVLGDIHSNIVELPPGFNTLNALTQLHFKAVR